jgi:pimeloyl-ACP methyl ester carboxylesterase
LFLKSESRHSEAVVLIHGLWLSGYALGYLARGLRRQGFDTHRFSYPSAQLNLRESAERLNEYLKRIDAPAVHLVGQSLGGILIRALFHFFPDQRPGRVVTLGTPHQGSHAARRLLKRPWTRRMVGPAVQELDTGEPRVWPLPQREIGVIRGTVPIGLGRLVSRPIGVSDGLLTAEEASLPGATDEIALPVAHSGMLFSRAVLEQTSHFLRQGRFRK